MVWWKNDLSMNRKKDRHFFFMMELTGMTICQPICQKPLIKYWNAHAILLSTLV
jgi:hypothetical protein